MFNTVVARDLGVRVANGYSDHLQNVVGNAVFSELSVEAPSQSHNIHYSYALANRHLRRPFSSWRKLDLRPLPGALEGAPIDFSQYRLGPTLETDIVGSPRDGTVRGAYAGSELPFSYSQDIPLAVWPSLH